MVEIKKQEDTYSITFLGALKNMIFLHIVFALEIVGVDIIHITLPL